MYLIRLDDACSYCDVGKWQQMEKLLDKYGIKPIVAIIPNCRDPLITKKYSEINVFWDKAREWQEKGWTIALHGYDHVYLNYHAKGINPINNFSEFTGLSINEQKIKIRNGLNIFEKQGLRAKVFVAPGHSFDENSLLALKEESDIRIISDTIAHDIYYRDGFYFIPQQCGAFRKLPFSIITACYHPNAMNEISFDKLELFINKNYNIFTDIDSIVLNKRSLDIRDKIYRSIYFIYRNNLKKYFI